MLSEQDEQLLEEYLDDALPADQVEELTARLAREQTLSAALAELRTQRRLRSAVWAALEPCEAEAFQLARAVMSNVRRRQWATRFSWGTRVASAAAACLLVGVTSGWYLRGRNASPANTSPANSPSLVSTQTNSPTNNAAQSPDVHLASDNATAPNADNGQLHFIGTVDNAPSTPYQVVLTDQAGNIVGIQRFSKLEDAQHFAQDLGQAAQRQQNVNSGHVTLAADHF